MAAAHRVPAGGRLRRRGTAAAVLDNIQMRSEEPSASAPISGAHGFKTGQLNAADDLAAPRTPVRGAACQPAPRARRSDGTLRDPRRPARRGVARRRRMVRVCCTAVLCRQQPGSWQRDADSRRGIGVLRAVAPTGADGGLRASGQGTLSACQGAVYDPLALPGRAAWQAGPASVHRRHCHGHGSCRSEAASFNIRRSHSHAWLPRGCR